MGYDNEINEELLSNFMLLSNAIKQTKNPDFKVDLSKIEQIINHKIPETLKKNAPAESYELYVDFKLEYEKFRNFILYDQLIGKNIVALGGGFSSGKSSFLNAFNGEAALPEDVDPSTSVPTYIVYGEKHKVLGINIFDTKVEIGTREIKKISHGFGELEDDDGDIVTTNTTLGHVLESIFLATPKQRYENIAFLDTPGYSKPDTVAYSAKTDEQIARGQLNASNFILWFVQADAGTITEEDIKFIKTLREDIPKLIVLNKADKKTEKDLEDIITKIKAVLDIKGVRYVDVLTYSNILPTGYDSEKIKAYFQEWNERIYESNFARNFKILFVRCREFYENEIEEERRRLNRLNTSITKLSSEDISSEVIEPLGLLVKDIQKNINQLVSINQKVKELQDEFFTEIKFISDVVGIDMPEPSEIDLLQDKVQNPLKLIMEYKKSKGIKTNPQMGDMLKEMFEDVKPVFNRLPGGSEYKNELLQVIKENCNVTKENIRFNDVYKNTERYKEIIDTI